MAPIPRLMLVLLVLGPASAPAAQKFDAQIGRILAEPATAAFQEAVAVSLQKRDARLQVEALVRVQGDEPLAALAGAGARIRSVIGNVVSVDIPVDRLAAVAALPQVAYLEGSRRIPARLNHSVPATRANQLRSGTAPNYSAGSLTGKGVIVGIIDDGLDFRHADFRNADGSTRLIGLWDQRASGAAGSPPQGFAYGGECTSAMMNAAIAGDASACTQPSTGNHGTHVGAIAAGNGQQSGNGAAAYRFIGMAPEADILSANSLSAGGNGIVDAIAWMKAKAQAAGKPLAINMSFGSYFGARDGTSNFEKALDAAGATGVILAGAAGNEGGDPIRAVGTLSQGQTVNVTFNWPESVTKAQRFELWYAGQDQYAIRVRGPNGCETPFVAAGVSETYTPACGRIQVTSTDVQTSNDDRQILVDLAPEGSQMAGAWTIELRGDAVQSANTPFSIICGEDGNGIAFTSHLEAVTNAILTDASIPASVIAVAAYNTNYNWRTTGGAANTPPDHGPIGDISRFSSRGPRRDCSNLVKCPRVMKPDITAPGAMIMAALGHDAPRPNGDTVEEDGQHVAYNGTSMATPHVTGAIALLLQKNPALAPADVKRLLAQNRQANEFTTSLPTYDSASALMPATPNYTFGYGILDAAAAANAIAAGAVTASTASIDFGGQSMSTTSPAIAVTVTNGSASTVTVTGVAASPHFAASTNCGALAPSATCTASFSFTPGSAGALSGTGTVTHSAGALAIALAGIGERSLVTHYYRSILRRAPDAGGKAFWESEAARMAALGANVNETWYALAMTFLFSAEYSAQGRNPTEFVRDLYSTFLNRSADAEGLGYWTGLLASGLSRESVLNSFMFSSEFAAFTRNIFGPVSVRPEIDTVVDFYRGLLARLPDSAGFNHFLQQFRQAQCSGGNAVLGQVEAISSAYANSPEYAARNRSHEQYVSDLYNAFLRRGSDLAGFQFWVGQIANNVRTRETVRRDFMASPEFNARVAAIVAAGCHP